MGGWDTHVNQGNHKGQLANRLRPLGEGLAGLARGSGEAWRDTVVVVLSEFGRTVRENGNGGTDHGHGNVIWVLGGALQGGRVYGDWPGLAPAQLYQKRDLAVTTDFRAALGCDPRAPHAARRRPARRRPSGRAAAERRADANASRLIGLGFQRLPKARRKVSTAALTAVRISAFAGFLFEAQQLAQMDFAAHQADELLGGEPGIP